MNNSRVIFIVLGCVFLSAGTRVLAQYKQSSNDRVMIAAIPEDHANESAYAAVYAFISLPMENNREDWESMLSSKCFYRDTPIRQTDQWYASLRDPQTKFRIVKEGDTTRNNQKIFYLEQKGSRTKSEKAHVILVRERGSWKILYAGL